MGRIEFASCVYLGMLATKTEYQFTEKSENIWMFLPLATARSVIKTVDGSQVP